MPAIPNQTDGQPDVQRHSWPIIPVNPQPGTECDDWSSMPNTSSTQTQPHIQGMFIRIHHVCEVRTEKSVPRITDCHQEAY